MSVGTSVLAKLCWVFNLAKQIPLSSYFSTKLSAVCVVGTVLNEPLVIPESPVESEVIAVYLIISLFILTYPGFVLLIAIPSKVLYSSISAVFDVVVIVISSVEVFDIVSIRVSDLVSVRMFERFTKLLDECIPWLWNSTFICKPSLILLGKTSEVLGVLLRSDLSTPEVFV